MKKGRIGTIALILVFVVGLALLLYPSVSNYWNSLHQSKVIVDYSDSVDELNEERYARLRAEAEIYNRALVGDNTIGEAGEYEEVLDPAGNGVMGYIEIPVIGVALPLAHGTSENVLKDSVGHLEWSSLPIGGTDTHCVISAHRGLPSAELFTNIDRLSEGDRFLLHVLGEELEYEVDKITVVEPHEADSLSVVAGEDYVTLVTCTPYGINSHRLLVRGSRVGAAGGSGQERIEASGDAREISPLLITSAVVAVIVVICFAVLLLRGMAVKRKEQRFGE